MITLGISIVSGYIGGWICSCECFAPPHALFRDDDHFHEALENYPPEYFTNCDEAGEYAVEGLKTWRAALGALTKDEKNAGKSHEDVFTTAVWNEHAAAQQESLDKQELLSLINACIDANKEGLHEAMNLPEGAGFNKLFSHLDG